MTKNNNAGETWLGFGDSAARSNINSLLRSLGVALEVWQSPFGPSLRRVPWPNTDTGMFSRGKDSNSNIIFL